VEGDLVLARVHIDLEGFLAIDELVVVAVVVVVVGGVALDCGKECVVVESKFGEEDMMVEDIYLDMKLEKIEMPFQRIVFLILQMVLNTILTTINIHY
jgi:hypothetical protein